MGALFALHKTKLHFIGVNYLDSAGKNQGILFQGDKSNFRAIIVALQGVTGAPISVSEKERGEIPAGVTVHSVKDSGEGKQNAPATATAAKSAETPASVSITSNPDGAEIYIDEGFVGNAPSAVKFHPGKHTIRVTLSGYKPWSRTSQGNQARSYALRLRLRNESLPPIFNQNRCSQSQPKPMRPGPPQSSFFAPNIGHYLYNTQ